MWRGINNIILSVQCQDCVASQGGCKHAIAFLMWVHRRSEEPSCTSVECYWKKFRLSRVGTARVVTEGFYVDDLLWSCQSKEHACKLQDDLISLLKSGGFELRKWASNYPDLLDKMNSDQVSTINFQDDMLSPSLKVLGLTYLPACNCFAFNYNLTDTKPTKRSVLKLLASIYDPAGYISVPTFVAKCIMQDNLWKLGIGWDDPLPPEQCSQWFKFISELPL